MHLSPLCPKQPIFTNIPLFPSVFRIHRAALWILGEYCTTIDNIQSLMNEVRSSLGEIPIVDDETRKAKGENTDGRCYKAEYIG